MKSEKMCTFLLDLELVRSWMGEDSSRFVVNRNKTVVRSIQDFNLRPGEISVREEVGIRDEHAAVFDGNRFGAAARKKDRIRTGES